MEMTLAWSHRLSHIVVLGLVSLLLFSGCTEESLFNPAPPITVRFVPLGPADYYTPLVEGFQKRHRNVSIEFVSGGRFFQQDFSEVDVLPVWQFQMSFLTEQEALAELAPFIIQDSDFSLEDFYPSAVSALQLDGQQWGIPYMGDVMVMYYNKDLFDGYGVPYPDPEWTWDAFLQRAQALSNPDAGQFGFAYHQMGQFSLLEPMLLIYQYGGGLFDDLLEPTAMTLDDPRNVAPMEWYADLIHRYHVAPRPDERQVPFPDGGIRGGKYAMWFGWLSDYPDWKDLHVGVAPVPRGPAFLTFGSVVGLGISARTLVPDESWNWLSYVSAQPPPGMLPLRLDLDAAEVLDGTMLPPDALAAGRVSVPHMMTLGFFSRQGDLGSRWGIVMQAFSGALVAIQNGDPVGPALSEAQRKAGF